MSERFEADVMEDLYSDSAEGPWMVRAGNSDSPPGPAPPPASAARTITSASRRTLRLRPRLVDDEVAVPEEAAVQHFDGLGRFLLGAHLHEAEAARPSGELVRDDTDSFHRTGLREQLAEVFLRSLEGKVANEELCLQRLPVPCDGRVAWETGVKRLNKTS